MSDFNKPVCVLWENEAKSGKIYLSGTFEYAGKKHRVFGFYNSKGGNGSKYPKVNIYLDDKQPPVDSVDDSQNTEPFDDINGEEPPF